MSVAAYARSAGGNALSGGLAVVATAAMLVGARPALAGEVAVAEVQRAAYNADFKGGIANLERMAAADRNDAEAQFGIGGLRFLGALANLQQALWQHSTAAQPPAPGMGGLGAMSPLALRLGMGFGAPTLLPPNPKATPMTYKALRQALARFVDDLDAAEEALARVGDRPVKVALDPFKIAIDLDHDNVVAPHERLISAFTGGRARADATISFDTADAAWLRGYANLLMASASLMLAADFEKSYEAGAHNLYGLAATAFGREMQKVMERPRPKHVVQAEIDEIDTQLAALKQNPADQTRQRELMTRLRELPRGAEGNDERRQITAELATINAANQRYHTERNDLMQAKRRLVEERAGHPPGGQYASIMDLVAAVHAISWPIVEPQRLKAVRQHLVKVMALNRDTWRLARAEADDDREWLPNARQTSPFPGFTLTDETIDAWLATTKLAEDVLEGRKLLPHPRFNKGINLKRLLESAPRLDLVMLMTGHDVVPYLEEGEIVSGRTWTQLTRPLQPNMWSYAIWLN